MKEIWYPTSNDIISINKQILNKVKITKAEKHELKIGGKRKIENVIQEAIESKGSIEHKASILLRGINQAHSFGSANKRTGYLVARMFLSKNKGKRINKYEKNTNGLKNFGLKVRAGKVKDKDIEKFLNK